MLKPPQLPEFPQGTVANTLTYPAGLARLLVNDFIAILDFFEWEILPDLKPNVIPAVRIKATPSVLSFFVEQCGRYSGETK